MKLTDYPLRRKIRSLLSRPGRRKPAFRPLADTDDILLLCHAKDMEAVQPCIDRLHMMHKKVYTGIYSPDGRVPAGADSRTLFLNGKKDLNLWHLPSSAALKRFGTVEADLIIDLTPPDCLPMRYVMLRHPCRFKTGVRQAPHEPDFYDLSILPAGQEDIRQVFGHILFYLQAIRSE